LTSFEPVAGRLLAMWTLIRSHRQHDAEVLEKEFGEDFRAQQFVDLDRYEVFVRLLKDGESQPHSRENLAR